MSDLPSGSNDRQKTEFEYHPRIRERALEDQKGHNFPHSFDKDILQSIPGIKINGSLLYRKPGTLNGKNGFFEIALNPKTKMIVHRTFVGAKK